MKTILWVITALATWLLTPSSAISQWAQTSGPEGGHILTLEVKGTTVFAGGVGGVFRSTDAGTTWSWSSVGLTTLWVEDLAVIGSDLFAAEETRVIRSTDDGASWADASTGLNGKLCPDVRSVRINAPGRNMGRRGFRFHGSGRQLEPSEYRAYNPQYQGPRRFRHRPLCRHTRWRHLSLNRQWCELDGRQQRSHGSKCPDDPRRRLGSLLRDDQRGIPLDRRRNVLERYQFRLELPLHLRNVHARHRSVRRYHPVAFPAPQIGVRTWTAVNSGLTVRDCRDMCVNGTDLLLSTFGGVFRSSDAGRQLDASIHRPDEHNRSGSAEHPSGTARRHVWHRSVRFHRQRLLPGRAATLALPTEACAVCFVRIPTTMPARMAACTVVPTTARTGRTRTSPATSTVSSGTTTRCLPRRSEASFGPPTVGQAGIPVQPASQPAMSGHLVASDGRMFAVTSNAGVFLSTRCGRELESDQHRSRKPQRAMSACQRVRTPCRDKQQRCLCLHRSRGQLESRQYRSDRRQS